MMRVLRVVLAGFFLSVFILPKTLWSETVIAVGNYTAPADITGDLVVAKGSIKIDSAGDLLVRGDVKVNEGSVFVNSGKLRVFGDLIVSNTLASGSASIVVNGDIEVSGSIITKSLYSSANITNTGASSDGTISAESIFTSGQSNSSLYAKEGIAVVGMVDLFSATDNAFVETLANNIYAGNIATRAYGTAYVKAAEIEVVGDVYTQGTNGIAYVLATTGGMYAGNITTSGGVDAYVMAAGEIIARGGVSTTSTSATAYVQSEDKGLYAKSITTNGYGNAFVNTEDKIWVKGDIRTHSSNGYAYIIGSGNGLIAANVYTDGYGSGELSARDGIDVRREISLRSTTGDTTIDANANGDIVAYKITTSGYGTSYIKTATGEVNVRGPISLRSFNDGAYIKVIRGGLTAESIFTEGYTNAYIECSQESIDVKNIISTKSPTGYAHVEAENNISAISLVTNGSLDSYVMAQSGSITVTGDIRTYSSNSDAYVKATSGDISARSIKTQAFASSDDSIQAAAGSGDFQLFLNTSDTALTVRDSEFFLDSDYVWNTALSLAGSCTLNGNGHRLQLGSNGRFIVSTDGVFLLKNIILDNVGGLALHCSDNTATFSFNTVSITQTSDSTFQNGSFHILGDCVISGSGTKFIYSSSRTSTIHSNSSLTLDKWATLDYNTTDSNKLIMVDSTSRLGFFGGGLRATENIRLTRGICVFEDKVNFAAPGDKIIFFGNGVHSENLSLEFHLRSEFTKTGSITNANS